MDLEWHIEKRRLVDLKPYEHNPRTIAPEMLEKLVNSIRENGYVARIQINPDGVIVGGHALQQALLALGYDEVEVLVPNRNLTPEEFDQINIRDNISFGQFDTAILADRFELDYLTELGLDVEFPDPDPVDPAGDEDEAPEPPATPVSLVGDLWEIGPHRLVVGDSTNLDVVSGLFSSHKANMTFTDPPYNLAYVGKTKDAMTIQNDKMGREDFVTFLKQAFAGMAHVTQEGGGNLRGTR